MEKWTTSERNKRMAILLIEFLIVGAIGLFIGLNSIDKPLIIQTEGCGYYFDQDEILGICQSQGFDGGWLEAVECHGIQCFDKISADTTKYKCVEIQ